MFRVHTATCENYRFPFLSFSHYSMNDLKIAECCKKVKLYIYIYIYIYMEHTYIS